MTRRETILVAIACVLITSVFIGSKLLSYANEVQLRAEGFERAAQALQERTEAVARRAGPDYEQHVLSRLGQSGVHGSFVHLIDQTPARIEGARASDASAGSRDGSSVLFELDFNGQDDSALLDIGDASTASISNGTLDCAKNARQILLLDRELDIQRQSVGEIHIRMKTERGRQATFGWNADHDSWTLNNRVGVDLVPDNTFREYRIAAAMVLQEGGLEEPIGRLAMRFSDDESDTCEVDYIRLISRTARYAGSSFGITYEDLGGVMRRSLYLWGQHSAAYDVEVPEKDPALTMAVGSLIRGQSITYRIKVEADGDTGDGTMLWEHVGSGDGAWHPVRLSLSPWAGQNIKLSLEVDGEVDNVGFWAHPKVFGAPPKPRKVIVVLEDTLRADHLGVYGYNRDTSPFRARMAARGALFEHAFSQATKTRPSVPSYMTSLLPSTTGVWGWTDRLDESYVTLAEVLRADGYATASFIQNGNAGPAAGVHQGFQSITGREVLGYRSDAFLGPEVFSWLEDHSAENFFLYLHLVDPHGPYVAEEPPYDVWSRDVGEGGRPVSVNHVRHDPESIKNPTVEGRRARYDGEILKNDHVLESLWAHIESLGFAEDVLFVLMSDHGEHLGEHGLWEHVPPGYIQVNRVPLLISLPGIVPENVRLQENVQMADMMPTVLDLLDIDTSEMALFGDSLAPLARGEEQEYFAGRMVVSEEPFALESKEANGYGSLFYREWHMLYSSQIDRLQLYAQARGFRAFNFWRDPQEEERWNRFAVDRGLRDRCIEVLAGVQRSGLSAWQAWRGDAEESTMLDPATQEHLRALGYIE